MTSFAFILGVAPLAVATALVANEALTGHRVLFGMLGVTGFGLIFTPAFYIFIRTLAKTVNAQEVSRAALKSTAIILALSLIGGVVPSVRVT